MHKMTFQQKGLVAVLVLGMLSFALRYNDLTKVTGAENLEATYHALLTVTALDESPARNHYFLPTVTLGNKGDKHIPWGATLPTATGDYIYTSFPPLGFVVPYFFIKLIGLDLSVFSLSLFNVIVGISSSAILFTLLYNVLLFLRSKEREAYIGALCGTLISIFSSEVMKSHGLIYWPQSLSQLFIISSLYMLFKYIVSSEEEHKNAFIYETSFLFFVFCSTLTEWTGYVYGTLLSVFFFCISRKIPYVQSIPKKIVSAMIFSGLLTVIHFGVAIGFNNMLSALYERFMVRHTYPVRIIELWAGVLQSFGAFFYIAIVALLVASVLLLKDETHRKQRVAIGIFFLTSCFPVFENLALMQHATEFTFDRLKIIFPAAVAISIAYYTVGERFRLILCALVIVASFLGIAKYNDNLNEYSIWRDIDSRNTLLKYTAANFADINTSLLCFSYVTRGYDTLFLHRNSYELKSFDESLSMLNNSSYITLMYFETVLFKEKLPEFKKITVVSNNNIITTLEVIDFGFFAKKGFSSNEDFDRGVSTKWAGFYIPNTEVARKQLQPGVEILFKNGERRAVTQTRVEEKFLHVYVDGPLLDRNAVGQPWQYFIVKSLSRELLSK